MLLAVNSHRKLCLALQNVALSVFTTSRPTRNVTSTHRIPLEDQKKCTYTNRIMIVFGNWYKSQGCAEMNAPSLGIFYACREITSLHESNGFNLGSLKITVPLNSGRFSRRTVTLWSLSIFEISWGRHIVWTWHRCFIKAKFYLSYKIKWYNVPVWGSKRIIFVFHSLKFLSINTVDMDTSSDWLIDSLVKYRLNSVS